MSSNRRDEIVFDAELIKTHVHCIYRIVSHSSDSDILGKDSFHYQFNP